MNLYSFLYEHILEKWKKKTRYSKYCNFAETDLQNKSLMQFIDIKCFGKWTKVQKKLLWATRNGLMFKFRMYFNECPQKVNQWLRKDFDRQAAPGLVLCFWQPLFSFFQLSLFLSLVQLMSLRLFLSDKFNLWPETLNAILLHAGQKGNSVALRLSRCSALLWLPECCISIYGECCIRGNHIFIKDVFPLWVLHAGIGFILKFHFVFPVKGLATSDV